MATLVLLWGNSPTNKEWIQEVNKELLPFYDTTHIHHYRHRTEWGTINFGYECDKLYEQLKKIPWSIIILGKSFGCILALKVMVEKEIFIKQSIFLGFPLEYCKRTKFPLTEYLKELTSPVLRIHKTNDPAGKYTTITKECILLSPAFTGKELPGNDHNYKEIKTIKQIILDHNAT